MNCLVANKEPVMSAVLKPRLTLQEYLAWENAQTEKHEFHRGDIFAMTGGRRTHGRVMLNLLREGFVIE